MRFPITIGIMLLCLASCNDENRGNELNKILSIKNDSLKLLTAKIDTLLRENKSFKEDLNYWFSDKEIDELKEKGIINPLKDIKDKLYANPKIIPYPAVLGGTMHFGNISLLSDRWVIADFDDGHIMGAMILKYTVQKDTSLKWTVIDKYIE